MDWWVLPLIALNIALVVTVTMSRRRWERRLEADYRLRVRLLYEIAPDQFREVYGDDSPDRVVNRHLREIGIEPKERG